MTFAGGSFHVSDARAYTPGGLVGHNVQVDSERERLRQKNLREIEEAHAARTGAPRYRPIVDVTSRPRPFPLTARGPVIWYGAAASSTAAPVATNTNANPNPKPPQSQQQHSAAPRAPVSSLLELSRVTSASSPAQPRNPHARARLYGSSYNGLHADASNQRVGGHCEPAPTRASTLRLSPPPPLDARAHAPSSSGESFNPPTPTAHAYVPAPVTQAPPAAVTSIAAIAAAASSSSASSDQPEQLLAALQQRPLRRGKWTKAEEEFAAATIRYFCAGLLNLQFGSLLRGFLATQLHCHPMRISKKLLPGTTFCGVEISRKLGRRAYSPRWCDSPDATQQKLDAESHLARLRAAFVASLEQEADESDNTSDDVATTASVVAATNGRDLRQMDTATTTLTSHAPESASCQARASTSSAAEQQRLFEQLQPSVYVQQQQQQRSQAAPLQQQQQQEHPLAGRKRSRDEWPDAELEPSQQQQRRGPFAPSQSQSQSHNQQPNPQYYRHEYPPASHPPQHQQHHPHHHQAPPHPASYRSGSHIHVRASPSGGTLSGWYPPSRSMMHGPVPIVAQRSPLQQREVFPHPHYRTESTQQSPAMGFHRNNPMIRVPGTASSYIQQQQQLQQQKQQQQQIHHDHQSFSEGRDSGSSSSSSVLESPAASASAPLLPSLRASLQRASAAATYSNQSRSPSLRSQQQQQRTRGQEPPR